MQKGEPSWGVRLADIRVTRYWLWALVVSALLVRRRDSRAAAELQKTSTDLAQFFGARMRESDDRDLRLLALTQTLTRLTWALLLATLAVLALTVAMLLGG